MTGGRWATRGFVVQSVCVLLEAFDLADWDNVTLEPDEPTEKVDIAWGSGATPLRKVQVKSSENAFEKAPVSTWAEELARAAPGVDCRVLLCGPITGGVSDMLKTGAHGVRIECVSYDLPSLSAVCRDRLHHALYQAGRYGVGPTGLAAAIPRLAGVLFAEAVRARRWSREDLWKEVLHAVEPAATSPLSLSWCQNRIIRVEATGDCVETFIVSFWNSTDVDIPVPGVITRLTDSRNAVLYVFDGRPSLEGEADMLGGVYTVWTPPRGPVPARGWRHLGCVVHRPGFARLQGGILRYEDVFLPPDSPGIYEARAWAILPRRWAGNLEAGSAEIIDCGGCGWRLSLEVGSYPSIEVTARPASSPEPPAGWVQVISAVADLALGNVRPPGPDLSAFDGLTDLPIQAIRNVLLTGSVL